MSSLADLPLGARNGELPARLLAFVFDPWSSAHPARLAAALPDPALLESLSGAHGHAAAARNAGLIRTLGLALDRLPDTTDPAERIAVSSPDELEALARRIGLVVAAPRLRRVIRREELALLDGVLDAADWKFVCGQAASLLPAKMDLLPVVPIADVPAAVGAVGVAVLERFAAAMPAALGGRLLLKLPPVPPSRMGVETVETLDEPQVAALVVGAAASLPT